MVFTQSIFSPDPLPPIQGLKIAVLFLLKFMFNSPSLAPLLPEKYAAGIAFRQGILPVNFVTV